MSDLVQSSGGELTGGSGSFDLAGHEAGLLMVITRLGLPSENVLVPVDQRVRVFNSIEATLKLLPDDHRERSAYLAKFLAAVASGLFDAALNYLWDETVGELRRRVANYDLAYFFDVAVGSQPERRKKLDSVDDLSKVEDYELIVAAQKMGLISEVGLKQLDLVRYMRNHASAAHPNQVNLRALQLLEYLETCIVEVITLPETTTVAEIRRLLANVKEEIIDTVKAEKIAGFFKGLGTDQATNLGNGFFGIYSSVSSAAQSRTNVRLLFPSLWPLITEEVRQQFGVKYARYMANGDAQQAELARELLDVVGAERYLPEDVRIVELDLALDALSSAHHGFNNFHAEGQPARALRKLVGPTPHVPAYNTQKYVHTVVDAYLGNGYGVSNTAGPIYEELINAFDPNEALVALLSFTYAQIQSSLQMPLSQARWRELMDILRHRIVGEFPTELVNALDAYTGPMDKASTEVTVKKALQPFMPPKTS